MDKDHIKKVMDFDRDLEEFVNGIPLDSDVPEYDIKIEVPKKEDQDDAEQ